QKASVAGAAWVEPRLVVFHPFLRLSDPAVMQVVNDRVVEGDTGNPVKAPLGGFQVAAVQPLQPFLDLSQRFQVVADVAVGEDPGGIGPGRLGDSNGFGRQRHALLVILVEAGQPGQADIGDGEIRARSKWFEDGPRPLVLGAGEIGPRLQPETAPQPESKPGRLVVITEPSASGQPSLPVSMAKTCPPGKEMAFAQLALPAGSLTRIRPAFDDPLIEHGRIRVSLVGFGSPGRQGLRGYG